MTAHSGRLSGILESVLYATDLVAAEDFYHRVLGLEIIGRVEGRHVFFRCGEGVLLLFDPDETSRSGGEIPPHGTRGQGHLAFAIGPGEAELEGWRRRLVEAGVSIEAELSWPRGGRSLYLRDPAGNSVELAPRGIWGIEDAV